MRAQCRRCVPLRTGCDRDVRPRARKHSGGDDPEPLRYSVNAFLHSAKSTLDMLRIDMERAGEHSWRQARVDAVRDNDLFSAFSRGRDLVVHRGSLVRSSSVTLDLFRYRTIKLVMQADLKADESSRSLLQRMQAEEFFNEMAGREREAIGEQLGVQPIYREPRLSTETDVVGASAEVLELLRQVLDDAHEHLELPKPACPDACGWDHTTAPIDTLLETDVGPSLLDKWGW